jgi:hypothetical protein
MATRQFETLQTMKAVAEEAVDLALGRGDMKEASEWALIAAECRGSLIVIEARAA